MQVSIEKVSAIKQIMTVTVPEEEVKKAMDVRYRAVGKTAKVPGYRPGKVPLERLKQMYGASVHQEVVSKIMQDSYMEALREKDLAACGYPTIKPVQTEVGQPLIFTAEFEVYPEIKLESFDGYEIVRPQASVAEKDIDDMVSKVQEQHKEWQAVERAAKSGDTILMDYEGRMDGELFTGGSAEKATLELGSGRFIEGFETGLEGSVAGDEKVLPLTFPEQYHQKDYAGKDVVFTVKVHEVREVKLPAVDDALAEKLNIKEGGVTALRDNLAKHMVRELKQAVATQVKQQVMDALLSNHGFDVPSALVEQEAMQLQKAMKARFEEQFGQKDLPELPTSHFTEEATRRVKLGLLLAEIVKVNDLSASEDAISSYLTELAEPYQDSEQVIAWHRGNKEKMAEVKAMVIEQALVDFVLDKAKVEDREMGYQEAIEWRKSQQEQGAEQETK
jgi:trigger factor